MSVLDANVWVAAFDPHDRFHESSAAFLRSVSRSRLQLHGPAFVALEAACALARRAGDPSAGELARERLHAHPMLAFHPVDEHCLSMAEEMGVRLLLRGADALYAATARLLNVPLISWDGELVQRAGALTPDAWLEGQG